MAHIKKLGLKSSPKTKIQTKLLKIITRSKNLRNILLHNNFQRHHGAPKLLILRCMTSHILISHNNFQSKLDSSLLWKTFKGIPSDKSPNYGWIAKSVSSNIFYSIGAFELRISASTFAGTVSSVFYGAQNASFAAVF